MDFRLNEEQMEIKRAAREFAEKEFTSKLARRCDEKHEFPRDLYKKAAKLGFICPHFDEEYGGQGLEFLETILVFEEFCRVGSTLGEAIHVAPFGSDYLLLFETTDQKKNLPKVAKGEYLSSDAFPRGLRRRSG